MAPSKLDEDDDAPSAAATAAAASEDAPCWSAANRRARRARASSSDSPAEGAAAGGNAVGRETDACQRGRGERGRIEGGAHAREGRRNPTVDGRRNASAKRGVEGGTREERRAENRKSGIRRPSFDRGCLSPPFRPLFSSFLPPMQPFASSRLERRRTLIAASSWVREDCKNEAFRRCTRARAPRTPPAVRLPPRGGTAGIAPQPPHARDGTSGARCER